MKTFQTFTLQAAATATGDGATVAVGNGQGFAVHFISTGTPVGTVTFEGTIDGTNWIAVPMENAAGTIVTTATAAGYFRLPESAVVSAFRARISAYTSGSFTLVAARR